MTADQIVEAHYLARGATLGQVYCRDARKPDLTWRELMAMYRRFYNMAKTSMYYYAHPFDCTTPCWK